MEPRAEHDPATAYHEAGHAVVALALGRPVHRVSVLPNRDRLGQCEFAKGVFRPSEDWAEREILISLAGMVAEARHTGTYGWAEAEQDLRYVRRLVLQRSSERAAGRVEKRLLAKAEYLLNDDGHWAAVELIAAELLKHGVISGRAARHLFDRGVCVVLTVYVDADACPVKDEVYKVAGRYAMPVVVVANAAMRVPSSPLVELVVRQGFGAADDYIAEVAGPGDVVITADIPLAARSLAKGARVIDPRGRAITDNEIGHLLGMRDLMDELRQGGAVTGGPPPMGPKDRSRFLSKLDEVINAVRRAHPPQA